MRVVLTQFEVGCDDLDAFDTWMQANVALVREEAGCVVYDYLRGRTATERALFAVWRDDASFERHRRQPPYRELIELGSTRWGMARFRGRGWGLGRRPRRTHDRRRSVIIVYLAIELPPDRVSAFDAWIEPMGARLRAHDACAMFECFVDASSDVRRSVVQAWRREAGNRADPDRRELAEGLARLGAGMTEHRWSDAGAPIVTTRDRSDDQRRYH